jgi:thiamine transport system substrate-binding protein
LRATAAAALLVLVVVTGCGDDDVTTTGGAPTTSGGAEATASSSAPPGVVRLLTHDSFLVSEEVLEDFASATGFEVEVLAAGDAGLVLNQAILTAGNPVADVLFGVDNTFLSRALDNNLFIVYESPALASVPDQLQLDPEHRVTPIDFGDVCLNYDKEAFDGLPPPATLADLADPAYAGMLVVENPATSSPGLAFLLATIATFPEDADYTWQDYWADLRANDVLVTDGWETAYYDAFSGGSGSGERPIVVSYASSPPAEVIYAEEPLDEAPTGVVTAGCYRQIEFAGILRGAANPEGAALLIDFMLSEEFQEDIPLNMFVFPANDEADLPVEFLEYTVVTRNPLGIDPATIDANREDWIDEWTNIVIR